MSYSTARIILPVLLGILGGAVAGLLTFILLPERAISPLAPAAFIRPRPENVQEPLKISEAMQSLVFFSRPAAGAEFISASDSHAVGIALTSDGLVVSAGQVGNLVEVLAISPDRSSFEAAFARDSEGDPFSNQESGLSFFKIASSYGEAPRLKPADFFSLEDIRAGQLAFAFSKNGALSVHRVLEVGVRSDPEAPLFSDELLPLIVLDGELEKGAPVFEPGGKLLGVAHENGKVFPAEFIQNILKQYLQVGAYKKTLLGVRFVDLSDLVALTEDLPRVGLFITAKSGTRAVVANSPAAQAGLKLGDTIVSFDGRHLSGEIPFQILLQRYASGTEVEAAIFRDGAEQKIKIVLRGG